MNKVPVLLIFLFGLLPFLNLFGKWPENLSFKMYAGTHPEAIFYFNSKDKNCFPAQLENNFIPIQVDINQYQYNLLLDDWSFKARSVPLFAHWYNYKEIGKKLCHCLENPELGGLKVFTVHPWDKSKESFTEIPCDQLFSNKH